MNRVLNKLHINPKKIKIKNNKLERIESNEKNY